LGVEDDVDGGVEAGVMGEGFDVFMLHPVIIMRQRSKRKLFSTMQALYTRDLTDW
jgi:hypothetical protein